MLVSQNKETDSFLEEDKDLEEDYLHVDFSFQKELKELFARFVEISKQEDVCL